MAGQFTILLIEDNEDDAFFVQRAFERAAPQCRIMHVASGEDGLRYLSGDPPYSDREKYPIPSAVLVDGHLKDLDGFETLKRIKNLPDRGITEIPIFMLSGSSFPPASDRAIEAGAVAYIEKTGDGNKLLRFAEEVCRHASLNEKVAYR